jgi:hypothetical protein
MKLPFKAAYMFRPGVIEALHGATSRTKMYRVFYSGFGFLLPVLHRLVPDQVTTTERIGRAMIAAARTGAPRTVLESRDINALAARGA